MSGHATSPVPLPFQLSPLGQFLLQFRDIIQQILPNLTRQDWLSLALASKQALQFVVPAIVQPRSKDQTLQALINDLQLKFPDTQTMKWKKSQDGPYYLLEFYRPGDELAYTREDVKVCLWSGLLTDYHKMYTYVWRPDVLDHFAQSGDSFYKHLVLERPRKRRPQGDTRKMKQDLKEDRAYFKIPKLIEKKKDLLGQLQSLDHEIAGLQTIVRGSKHLPTFLNKVFH